MAPLGGRGRPALSHSTIKGDLIRQQEVQEVAGRNAGHTCEIQGWPSARGPEVASLWRDRLAGASELQAWAGGCVRTVSDAH